MFKKVKVILFLSLNQIPLLQLIKQTQPRSISSTLTSDTGATPFRNAYGPFPCVSMSLSPQRSTTTSTSSFSYRTPPIDAEAKNITILDKLKIQSSVSTTRSSTTIRPDRPFTVSNISTSR